MSVGNKIIILYISNKAFVGLQSPSKVIFKENEKKRCKNVEEVKLESVWEVNYHPCNNVTRKTCPTFTTRNIMKCMGSKLP